MDLETECAYVEEKREPEQPKGRAEVSYRSGMEVYEQLNKSVRVSQIELYFYRQRYYFPYSLVTSQYLQEGNFSFLNV